MFRQSKAEQLRNIYFKFCIYVCVYMMSMLVPKRPEEGVKFSRAGVTSGCKLPYMGAGNKWFSARAVIAPNCLAISLAAGVFNKN